MEQIDELDQKIINMLKEDSRIAYTKIAEKLQVPDTTIHFRIKKLRNSNIIKNFTILISPESFGYNLGALLKIKVGDHIIKDISIKKTLEIGKSFAGQKNFCFVGTVEDGTILYCIIFTKSEEELDKFVSDIRHDPDIIDLEIVKFTNVIKGNELLGSNLL
ncbi:MAG TPA: AsnC family transcriptional regulator [Candidatus Deferrimicrobium sp.]|nr:AsnC family transcriptional regulator [Candidatus Deferrimicrobium sp.]